MKERILLIKPFSGREDSVAPPLGLLYIASYIQHKFRDYYDIKLLDMRLNNFKINRVESLIKDYKPDIIGLSVCSEEDKVMHEIALLIKRINTNITVIAGGPHATIYYRDILKDKNIDIAVIGEGEITFYEVLKNIRDGKDFTDISGIAYNMDGEIFINPPRGFIENLDELPFPVWDLLDIKAYSSMKVASMNDILSGYKYMGIITSRGCPYRCIYCHNIFGKRFRKRSTENVFKEIKFLVENYGIDEFQIYDDIFNLDVKRVHGICDMIINSNFDIKLAFPNGIRGDIVNKKLLLKLKKAGAYMVTFALESASERIQKLIKKNINRKKLLQNIKYADKIGLLTKCYFMIGFPTETMGEIKKTINFACRAPLDFAGFYVVTPHKGTELFKLVKKYYPEFKVDFYSAFNYYAENWNYERVLGKPLRKIQLYAYRRFYCNPKRILKMYIRMPRKLILFSNPRRYLKYFY